MFENWFPSAVRQINFRKTAHRAAKPVLQAFCMEVYCDSPVFQARLHVLPFRLYVIFSIKKALLPEKFLFRDESKELFSITISMLRVTTLNSPMPRGMSLINCGREMIRRQPVTVTGAPVVALAGGFGTRLRDHFGRFLGRLFPPVQALCGLSNRLLFSSQPFFL